MSDRRTVAVTGCGAVSAFGWGREALWDGLCSGTTAIGGFALFDHAAYETHVAAQVPEGGGVAARHRSRSDGFAVAAALEAVREAGWDTDLGHASAGVFFGSSTGGMLEGEAYYLRWAEGGTRGPDLRLLASQPTSCPGESVARLLHVAGPVETLASACASATLAIGAAVRAVREGEVDLALAGGSDALCRTTFSGFNALRSVDAVPCRPFRAGRGGLSLGEGAGVLALEPLDRALARGCRPLAVIEGFGSSSDGYHMTAPHPEGAGPARAMRAALDDAGLAPDSIDCIHAHGTGTPLNDAAEWRAFERVFGARAGSIPVTAIKASVGHLLGAAGGIEAVATLLCLWHRLLPPAPGGGPLDPALPVRLVTGRPLSVPTLRRALALNLGFGGCNAALVLGRAEPDGS